MPKAKFQTTGKTQIAKINYLHIAPRKVRLIGNTLKGLTAQEAEAQLMLRPQRASKELLSLLRSAIANAQNNQKINRDLLVISSFYVNPGPIIKRFLPRAQGRATPLQKKMSHVTLILGESSKPLPSRFVISPPVKKSKKSETKTVKPKATENKFTGRKPEKVGFFKKFFRRKAI